MYCSDKSMKSNRTGIDSMKRTVIGLLVIVAAGGLCAQTIKAEDLEKLCTSAQDSDRTACLLITKVYMDGFLEGVGKGVLDTYRYDPQVFALVKDVKMKDSLPQITQVIDSATCIQKVSVSEMAATYVDYVRGNPALRQGHYRKAMTLAIVAKYCGKYGPYTREAGNK